MVRQARAWVLALGACALVRAGDARPVIRRVALDRGTREVVVHVEARDPAACRLELNGRALRARWDREEEGFVAELPERLEAGAYLLTACAGAVRSVPLVLTFDALK